MISLPESDILEYEVKWILVSITKNKASGGDGIPAELFQILKDDVVKVLHSVCQQIWKNSSAHKTAAAAKSLQSCPTLCDSIDGSPPGFPVPGILQARTLEWVAISFSNA